MICIADAPHPISNELAVVFKIDSASTLSAEALATIPKSETACQLLSALAALTANPKKGATASFDVICRSCGEQKSGTTTVVSKGI